MPRKPFQWLGYWQLWRSRRARQEMTELLWNCRKCGGSDDRMEAVPGRRRWFLFGKRKTKLIAICLDCWSEMDFLGTVWAIHKIKRNAQCAKLNLLAVIHMGNALRALRRRAISLAPDAKPCLSLWGFAKEIVGSVSQKENQFLLLRRRVLRPWGDADKYNKKSL